KFSYSQGKLAGDSGALTRGRSLRPTLSPAGRDPQPPAFHKAPAADGRIEPRVAGAKAFAAGGDQLRRAAAALEKKPHTLEDGALALWRRPPSFKNASRQSLTCRMPPPRSGSSSMSTIVFAGMAN